jgi:hypothetical protein
MPKIGRSRVASLVVLVFGALAVGSASSSVSAAHAGALEGLPGTVREVTESVEEVANGVAPTVQEVAETAPPPVAEVTETVTPPVVEATQAVVPPVREVAETATQATQEVIAKVPSPAATTPKPSTPAVDPSGETKAVTKTVTHDAEGALGAVTGAVNGGRSPASGGPTGNSTAGGGQTREAPAPTEADRADSAAKATGGGGDGMRGEKFDALSPDGSIRAPLPKWMAYVWPAIALTWHHLAGLLTQWEHEGTRFLSASDGGASDGGASGSQGVAGVHASHAAGASSDSSSSPFAPIPAAIGGFTSHVPGGALAYLAIVAILVAAVFFVVKYELARRDGRSS